MTDSRQWRGGIKIGTMIAGKPVEATEGIASRTIGMVEEAGTKRRTEAEIGAGKGTTEIGTGRERETGTGIRMEIEIEMVVEGVIGAIVVNEKKTNEIETRAAGKRYDRIYKNVYITYCPD